MQLEQKRLARPPHRHLQRRIAKSCVRSKEQSILRIYYLNMLNKLIYCVCKEIPKINEDTCERLSVQSASINYILIAICAVIKSTFNAQLMSVCRTSIQNRMRLTEKVVFPCLLIAMQSHHCLRLLMP